jgi:hypothetical protein
MGLEVINDLRCEVHRNWVCSVVTQALGDRIHHDLWVLRLTALDLGGISIALTGPEGAILLVRLPNSGRDQVRELERALRRAVASN